jgi:hypothetical protein
VSTVVSRHIVQSYQSARDINTSSDAHHAQWLRKLSRRSSSLNKSFVAVGTNERKPSEYLCTTNPSQSLWVTRASHAEEPSELLQEQLQRSLLVDSACCCQPVLDERPANCQHHLLTSCERLLAAPVLEFGS